MGKKQDVKNSMFVKPSPNEEVKLLQSEKEKLRKLRLQQVREQEKVLANRLRKRFKRKEKDELLVLGNELKRAWEDNITEKKTALENVYFENVSHVGEGHQDALMRPETGEPKATTLEEQVKVTERYKQAIKKLRVDEVQKTQIENEKTELKQRALEIERLRAAKIASLDPPAPDIAQSLEMIQKHKYNKEKSIDQYSSTYYHLPQELVEKADPNDNQFDAREAARDEGERIQNAKQEADRNFAEQMEKARLRHKHARSKLLLQKDRDKLLKELDHFERMDRQRRQDIVSKIPKHIFEPPHRRLEANEERQREMEHAFEDMYMAQTNYMGDISHAREPLPSSPAVSDQTPDSEAEIERASDLSHEMRDVGSDQVSDVVTDITDERSSEMLPGLGKKKIVEEAEKSRAALQPSGKDPLKRLMKKIDLQRDRWRSKIKTSNEDVERHDSEFTFPDDTSEFSEGLLTITTEKTQSTNTEETHAKPKATLLHPYEEAERTRTEVKERSQEFVMSDSRDIEKQKQLLQQQKLKLQLQQQQVLQEHLQLQFDMLQRENETRTTEDGPTTAISSVDTENLTKEASEDHDDIVDKEMLSTVSTDLLSEEEEEEPVNVPDTFHIEQPARAKEDISLPFTSHHDDSRLSSIPESVSEDDFTHLTPMPSEPTLGILPQPKPLHIQMPTATISHDDRTEQKPSLEIRPTQVSPVVPRPTIFTGKPTFVDEVGLGSVYLSERLSHLVGDRPLISAPAAPTLATSETSSDLPVRFQLPSNEGTDTVSYLTFYQEQLVEQQKRIREEQRAIEERQQHRLGQLIQFQEQLRSLRTTSEHGAPTALQNTQGTDVYWRSLMLRSGDGVRESSSEDDSRSSVDVRPHVGDFSARKENEITSHTSLKRGVPSDNGESSSSLSPYPSVIVPVRRFEDAGLFPKPSELGLWSDSTIQLSSSEVTKSSSNATIQEKDVKEQSQPRTESEEVSSSSPPTTKSSLEASRSSGNTSSKSKSSLESGPLSSSSLLKTDKSLSSESSDNNNNPLLHLESSFKHFQEMIEKAKKLNKKYLSPSKFDSEDIIEEGTTIIDNNDFGDLTTTSHVSCDEYPKEPRIPEEERVGSDDLFREIIPVTETSELTLEDVNESFGELFDQSHDKIFNPLQNMDELEYSTKDTSISDVHTSDGNSHGDDPQFLSRSLSIIPEETLSSEENFDEGENSKSSHDNSSEYAQENDVDQNVEIGTQRNHSLIFPSYPEDYTNEHHGSLDLNYLLKRDTQQGSSRTLPSDVTSKQYDDPNLDTCSRTVRDDAEYSTAITSPPPPSARGGMEVCGRSLSQTDESNTDGSDMSLQDAFRKHRSQFIKRSEERARAIKQAGLQEVKPPVFQGPSQRVSKEYTTTSDNDRHLPSTSAVNKTTCEEIVAAKSLRSKPKIDKQDMVARTKRLYQQLPDVQKKNLEKQREEAYAANRAKAQEFQKQTRERLRKLKDKKSRK